MALTDYQIQDVFETKVGRPATDSELQNFRNASFNDISQLNNVDYSQYQNNPTQDTSSQSSITTTLPTTPSYDTSFDPNSTNYESYAKNTGDYNFDNYLNYQATAQEKANLGNPPTAPDGSTQSDTLNQYQAAQTNVANIDKQIADIDNTINNALQNKIKEIQAQGGIVNESELRAQVAREQNDQLQTKNSLIAQRNSAAATQSQLGKQLQYEQAQQKLNLAQQNAQNLQDYRTASLNQRGTQYGYQNYLSQEKLNQNQSQFEAKQSQANEMLKAKNDFALQLAQLKATNSLNLAQVRAAISASLPQNIARVFSTYERGLNQVTAKYIDPSKSAVAKQVNNAIIPLTTVKAAMENPGNTKDNSIGDQALLDAVTRLDTGGFRPTEAQINLITQNRGFKNTVGVWQNKINSGGLLSPSQRKALEALANAEYKQYVKAYGSMYNKAVSAVNAQNIPDTAKQTYIATIPTPDDYLDAVSSASENKQSTNISLPPEKDPMGLFQ